MSVEKVVVEKLAVKKLVGIVFVLAALLLSGCITLLPTSDIAPGDSVKVERPFLPPDGQTLLIIGQDTASIDVYVQALDQTPGGVTGYTSLAQLEGLTSVAEYGSGPHHLDYLAETYPASALVVGLYLVDTLPAINNGQADQQITRLLDILGGYARPVFLRFGYEFDGPWNHYEPEAFKAAWIYFHTKMAEQGIDNVAMVWQSATACNGTYGDRPIEDWYPGDEVVDWVGFSYFAQVACDFVPLQAMVDFARLHDKPLMIAEATPQGYATGNLTYSQDGHTYIDLPAATIWDQWYAPFFAFIHENRDVVGAVAYINAHWDAQSMWGPPYGNAYWGDSRVQVNPLLAERWLAEVTGPAWLHDASQLGLPHASRQIGR